MKKKQNHKTIVKDFHFWFHLDSSLKNSRKPEIKKIKKNKISQQSHHIDEDDGGKRLTNRQEYRKSSEIRIKRTKTWNLHNFSSSSFFLWSHYKCFRFNFNFIIFIVKRLLSSSVSKRFWLWFWFGNQKKKNKIK